MNRVHYGGRRGSILFVAVLGLMFYFVNAMYMCICMHVRMGGWMDGWIDERVNGRMDE